MRLAAYIVVALATFNPAVLADEANRAGLETCFGSQESYIPGSNTAQSVVFLATTDTALGNQTVTSGNGTGVIIQGSSLNDDGRHLRILTAAHVASHIGDGGSILVISSSGRLLGKARAVAFAARVQMETKIHHLRGDQAVLAVEEFEPGVGLSDYDAIAGLPLAATQSAAPILAGFFGSPSGLGIGDSGSPLIFDDGSVGGIVSAIIPQRFATPKVVSGGNIVAMNHAIAEGAGAWLVTGQTAQASFNIGILEPVTDTAILKALGASDRVVASSRFSPEASIHATVTGFPDGICVVHKARVGPYPAPE